MVVEGTLIEIGVLGRRFPLEQMPGQLEHIVRVAGLRRAGTE